MLSRVASTLIKINDNYKIIIVDNCIKITYNNTDYNYSFDSRLICHLSNGSISFTINENLVKNKSELRELKKIVGFYVRDLQNFLTGLSDPFKSNIEIIGTGYKVAHNKQENFLNFSLGFSHDIMVTIPKTIIVEVAQNKIKLACASKALLGSFSNYLCRSLRKFDKFKGKGVILVGQYLQRKELKKK